MMVRHIVQIGIGTERTGKVVVDHDAYMIEINSMRGRRCLSGDKEDSKGVGAKVFDQGESLIVVALRS